MAQISTNRRNSLIVAVIIVVLVVASFAFLILVYQPSIANKPITNKPTAINLNVSLNQPSVIQGNKLRAQINVTSIGKAENITLSSNSGSSGINCIFEPSIGNSNFTSVLTMSIPYSAPTGNYSITIVASTDKQSVNASIIVSVLTGNVTVSGRASSAALAEPWFTSIQKIEFTDIQTGLVTSFSFSFSKQSYNPFGNYSVTLKNEHTYNVTISYFMGPSLNAVVNPASDYITTFTVYASAGQTAISKNFPGP